MKAITGKTRLIGVFGHPIAHSLSPAMHNAAIRELGLDCVYLAFDVDPPNLEQAVQAVRALNLVGVNVTIPYKEQVIPFLDEVSPEARAIGSVNTISNNNGSLIGFSTDGTGFLQPLEEAGISVEGRKAVVIGAGGSARAILYALASRGAEITVLNRTPERGKKLASEINSATSSGSVSAVTLEPETLGKLVSDADLLVNCTSVGMWPHVDETPCPREALHSRLVVYDLVYNPLRTRLVRAAEEAGALGINGLKMLVYQGAASLKIWTGYDAPTEIMEKVVSTELAALQVQGR